MDCEINVFTFSGCEIYFLYEKKKQYKKVRDLYKAHHIKVMQMLK